MPKISALPAAGAITGIEQVPIVQGGVTKRTTAAALTGSGGSVTISFSDGTTTISSDTFTITGAGSATVSVSGTTITITTPLVPSAIGGAGTLQVSDGSGGLTGDDSLTWAGNELAIEGQVQLTNDPFGDGPLNVAIGVGSAGLAVSYPATDIFADPDLSAVLCQSHTTFTDICAGYFRYVNTEPVDVTTRVCTSLYGLETTGAVFASRYDVGSYTGTTGNLGVGGTVVGGIVVTLGTPLPGGSTVYLDGDGNFTTPPSGGGSTSFANPTAAIGLAAVNGSATTAMRSDAAPALAVTIAPVWSGIHEFLTTVYLDALVVCSAEVRIGSGSWVYGFNAGKTVLLLNGNTANYGTLQVEAAGDVWSLGSKGFGSPGNSLGTAVLSWSPTSLETFQRVQARAWMQNTAGTRRLSADATNSTTTMASLTGLGVTVVGGCRYVGRLTLYASESTPLDGLAVDLDGGTATMTAFSAGIVGTPLGATLGTAYTTTLAGDLTATTASASDVAYVIELSLEVSAGGTLVPRFCQIAHTTGTVTIRAGSKLELWDSPN